MDPLRIIVRAVFAFVVVLALVRVSGRRSLKGADMPSFVVAVIIGDMFDDLLWSEVPASQFLVAVGTLFITHIATATVMYRSGTRQWRRAAAGGQP